MSKYDQPTCVTPSCSYPAVVVVDNSPMCASHAKAVIKAAAVQGIRTDIQPVRDNSPELPN